MPSQKGHSRDDHEGQGYHHEDPEIRLLSLILAEIGKTNDILQRGSCSDVATKQDLAHMECRIMSVISDHLAKQTAFNTRQAAAIDQVVASIAGVTSDIKTLNDKITELQNSSGGVTPEDQILINELETKGDELATKAEGLAAALKALDDQTPPVVPPAPPV